MSKIGDKQGSLGALRSAVVELLGTSPDCSFDRILFGFTGGRRGLQIATSPAKPRRQLGILLSSFVSEANGVPTSSIQLWIVCHHLFTSGDGSISEISMLMMAREMWHR